MLAEQNLAPKLLYVSTENTVLGYFGYKVMVVMEFLEGQTAKEFEYVTLKDRSIWRRVHQDVKTAINILHAVDLVFGDLRGPNILIVEGRAKLVDFDWCGTAGKNRYPTDLNPKIKWPTGVVQGGLMQKDNDMEMISTMFKGIQDMIEEE